MKSNAFFEALQRRRDIESGDIWADEILPGKLWLGSGTNARNFKKLREYGITHILNCSDDVPNFYEDDIDAHIAYLKLGIGDFGSDAGIRRTFAAATEFVASAIMEREAEAESAATGRVLVHCANGSNRSPTVIIAVLMRILSISLAGAWDLVSTRHKQTAPLRDSRAELLQRESVYSSHI